MTLTVVLMLLCATLAGCLALARPAGLVIFVLCAGTLRFGGEAGDVLGGKLDLSSLWLLMLIVCCVVGLLRSGALYQRFSGPEKCYLVFLGWCLLEAMRAPSGAFAARMFLKLLYPCLVMWLARNTIRTSVEAGRLLKWVMGSACVAYCLLGGLTERLAWPLLWAIWTYFWTAASFADYAAIMTVVALGCWRLFGQRRYLVLALALGTSSILAVTRTGILATAVGVAAFSALEWRRRALPLLVLLYFVTAGALFAVPEIRAKMFFDEKRVDIGELMLRPDRISIENIDSSGRFAMWKEVLDEFFWPNPVAGSGLGATQAWFYSGKYGRARVEHSEYVRLLADTGIIGIALYVSALAGFVISAWRGRKSLEDCSIRLLGSIGIALVPAYMVCMAFDNVLNYVLPATQYPFAFAGIIAGAGTMRSPAALRTPELCEVPIDPVARVTGSLQRPETY